MNNRGLGVIVEGRKDKDLLLLAYPDANVIYTDGTRFNKNTISKVQHLIETNHYSLVLTDPDDTGDIIAHKLRERFPQLRRIEVDPIQARLLTHKGYKFGIEYCTLEYLLSLNLM